MSERQTVEFIATLNRLVFSNEQDYWVYAMNVSDKEYPDIQRNSYGNVSLCGNIGDLSPNVSYRVVATPVNNKYGVSYQVEQLKREVPMTAEDVFAFLCEILTENQATELYKHYPDIIDRVKNNRLDDIDLNLLKGIKEKSFKKIVQKIVENFFLADLVAQFQGYINISTIKKLYQNYCSVESVIYALNHDPYTCLCSLSGIGFKTADKTLLDIEKVSNQNIALGKPPILDLQESLISSKSRCLACIIYLLEENQGNGHTKMNLAQLHKECLSLVPDAIHQFAEAIKSQDIFYDKTKMEISTSYAKATEEYIAKVLTAALQNNTNNVWNYDLSKYKTIDGCDLSEQQLKIVHNICQYNINILNGSAGTGKSFSTKAIIRLLDDHHKSYVLMSPTGKASKVLSEYTKKNCTTIHRGLGYRPPNEWGYNADNKLVTDIVIVDEFSMVDIFLFKKLLEAIDIHHTKLLLIGDNAQLPSVQCGNLLQDFMTSDIIPTVTLDKVFRYSEGGLMKIATDVRNSKTYLTKQNQKQASVFGANKDYTFIDTSNDTMPRKVLALYKKLLSSGYSPEDIQVLISKNVGNYGTVVFNKYLQQVANPNAKDTEGITYGENNNAITFYKDDIVIQVENNYKAKLCDEFGNIQFSDNFGSLSADEPELETAFVANGETGKIKAILKSAVVIDFDGVCVYYNKSELSQIKLGYSISIHKSQGSSIRVPILLTPSSDIYMLNSNLIYVGLTRMKDKCFHFGTVSSVNLAVNKKANMSRNTFMVDFLKQFAA